jgi:hypothetical protein
MTKDEKGRPMAYWGGLKQPAWQGLTDDEIARIDAKMIKTLRGENLTVDDWIKEFAHAIEQALKEKNTCS